MNDAVDCNVSPHVVIWENTRACDVACVHCRAAVQPRRSQFELTTEEGFALIDEVAALKPRLFVITGGDPLKREDTYEMIRYAKDRGIDPVLTPGATPLLTEGAVARMSGHGLSRLAVSLDGSRAETHDAFRRVEGSFDITVRAIQAARKEGIPVQVKTTVTRRTIDDLPNMVAMLTGLEIDTWSVFFLVPTGRGKRGDLLSPEAVEHLFSFLYETSKRTPFAIRTTEAMHYRRYTLQRLAIENGSRIEELRDSGTGLIDASALFDTHRPALPLGVKTKRSGPPPREQRGVNEGKGFAFISHTGDVFPSAFLPLKAGNVKEQSLSAIYQSSELFLSLRDTDNLKGRCGRCEFRELCGGSRARAWSMTGDLFESDPLCGYQPRVA